MNQLEELPPRARGRPEQGAQHPPDVGATPAGAGTTGWQRGHSSRASSYPRGRGDDRGHLAGVQTDGELPPRARGRLHRHDERVRHPGATPAGAGTTGSSQLVVRGNSSYPRRRGDDGDPSAVRGVQIELPPRAGTTPRPLLTNGATQSYPRGRGDDFGPEQEAHLRRELPPRARGRPDGLRPGGGSPRATPAGAGTTCRHGTHRQSRTSYPRGRGDDKDAVRIAWDAGELPPRARGRRDRCAGHREQAGATPAGAGTTSRRRTAATSPRSYPRGRGDDVRGVRRAQHGPRATPAGAGTTRRPASRTRSGRSYPRGRGDDENDEGGGDGGEELPPRARGRRNRHRRPHRRGGATPAGAGTTPSRQSLC